MTAPNIVVSSRDGAQVPHVPRAARLAQVATLSGWIVEQTYAVADVPERRYLNGEIAKAAHRLASVAVRVARGGFASRQRRGWAMWALVEGGSWRFHSAQLDGVLLGLREFTRAVMEEVS